MIKKVSFPSSSINTKNPAIKILNSHTQGISVYADKGRISQVIHNLLDNAIKFSESSEDNVIV
jgi:signal transduction histidine kinase